MPFDLWLTFAVASTLLLMLPGPTILLVVSYSLTQGRKVALRMAIGVALGDLIAMSASLAGLGALVLASATLFSVLKWVGAGYLVFLGIKLLRSKPALPDTATEAKGRDVFWHALTVTALNPKSIAFFIAFVPQFVDPHGALMPQFVVLVATFVTLATLNALAYAMAADALRARIRRPGVLMWMNRAGGGALVGMGALTAGLQRAA